MDGWDFLAEGIKRYGSGAIINHWILGIQILRLSGGGDAQELSGGKGRLSGKLFWLHHFRMQGSKRTVASDSIQCVTCGGVGRMKPLFITHYRPNSLWVRGE